MIRFLKSLGFFVITAICMMAFCITVSAQSVSKSEKKQVESAVKHYNEYFQAANVYGEKPNVKMNKNNSSLSNVYKSYIIEGLIIDDYEKTKNFSSLISDETKIFAESGNQLVTLSSENGKIEAIGSMILNDGEKLTNFEDEAKRISSQFKDKIIDMKFVKSYSLAADMIYYQTTKGEFIVPYFDNASENVSKTIENGKIYSANEFVDKLKCIIDLSKVNPECDGGIPYINAELTYSGDNIVSQNSTLYIIILASGLVLMSLAFVFISKKYCK